MRTQEEWDEYRKLAKKLDAIEAKETQRPEYAAWIDIALADPNAHPDQRLLAEALMEIRNGIDHATYEEYLESKIK